MTEFSGDAKFPEFDYESESDTLTIWGGGPARQRFRHHPRYSHPVSGLRPCHSCSLTLSPAVKLLAPHLPIKSIANIEPASYRDNLDLRVKYDCEKDTLWMSNSRPAETYCTLMNGSVEIWFQAGSESVLESDGKIPSGVMVYNAIKHIEAAILADLAELAAAGGTE